MQQRAEIVVADMRDNEAAYNDIHGKHVMHMSTDSHTGLTVVVLQPKAKTKAANIKAAQHLLVHELGLLLDAKVAR